MIWIKMTEKCKNLEKTNQRVFSQACYVFDRCIINIAIMFNVSFCCCFFKLDVIVYLLPVTGHQMATLMLNIQIPPLEI